MVLCVVFTCWLMWNTISQVFVEVLPRLASARYYFLTITTLWTCALGYWWKWGSPFDGFLFAFQLLFIAAFFGGSLIVPLVIACPSVLSFPAIGWICYHAVYITEDTV